MHRTQSGGCSCSSWHRDKKLTTSFEPSLLPPRFFQQKWTTWSELKLGEIIRSLPDRAEWHAASHLAELQPTRLENGKGTWNRGETYQKGSWQGILIVGYIFYPWTGIDPINGRVAERLFPKSVGQVLSSWREKETWTSPSDSLLFWPPSSAHRIGRSSWDPGFKKGWEDKIPQSKQSPPCLTGSFSCLMVLMVCVFQAQLNDLKASIPLGVPGQELGIA